MQKNSTAGGPGKSFEKSLELSPLYTPALEQIVNLDIAANQYTQALNLVNKPETGCTTLLAPCALGGNLFGCGQNLHGPRPDILRMEMPRSGSGEAKLNVPVAQDDVNHAEAALHKAIEMEPSRENSYLLLAQLYVSTGKEQVALDRLKSLVVKTNNPAV